MKCPATAAAVDDPQPRDRNGNDRCPAAFAVPSQKDFGPWEGKTMRRCNVLF